MAMGIGLTNGDDLLFMSFTDKEFKSVKVSTLKPSNGHLVGEQQCCCLKTSNEPTNVNMQAKQKTL